MALYTKKDFANLCGLETKHLSTYITRGNVVVNGDYIDDSNPKNYLFYQKRKANNHKAKIEERPGTTEYKTPLEPKNIPEPQKPKQKTGEMDLLEMEYEKKRLEIEKIKVDINLKRQTEDKINGLMFPVELAKELFREQAQASIKSQQEGIEDFLINLAHELRMSSEQLAGIRHKIDDIINRANNKALQITSRRMKIVVSEYSLKREID